MALIYVALLIHEEITFDAIPNSMKSAVDNYLTMLGLQHLK